MRPLAKCTAVRTPPTSRLSRISLAQSAVDLAPPTVRGIDGSFKLSKMPARNEFRNFSLTTMVASAPDSLAARRLREPVSCPGTLAIRKSKTKEAQIVRPEEVNVVSIQTTPVLACGGRAQRRHRFAFLAIATRLRSQLLPKAPSPLRSAGALQN